MDRFERHTIEEECPFTAEREGDHFHCSGCAGCPTKEDLPAGWWDLTPTRRPDQSPPHRPSVYTLCAECMNRVRQLASYKEDHDLHQHCNGCLACPFPQPDAPSPARFWHLSGCRGREDAPSAEAAPVFIFCDSCMAWFWEIAGETDPALALIRDEVDDPKEQIYRLAERAIELMADPTEERRYTILIQREPGAARYFRRRGRVRRHRGAMKGAIEDFTRAIDLAGKNSSCSSDERVVEEASGFFERARTLLEMGQLRAAGSDLAHIQKTFPEFPGTWSLLSVVCAKGGNHSFSKRCLDAAREVDAHLAPELLKTAQKTLWCGERFLAKGDPAVAGRCFETALIDIELAATLAPSLRDLEYTRGQILDRLGHPEESIRAYQAELAHHPDHNSARRALDRLMEHRG